MNEPIINPLIFYAISTLGMIRCVAVTVCMIVIPIYPLILMYIKDTYGDNEAENIFRKAKVVCVGLVVALLLVIFIPEENTMYKMMAASYVTQENLNVVGNGIDKIADKLIEKVNKIER